MLQPTTIPGAAATYLRQRSYAIEPISVKCSEAFHHGEGIDKTRNTNKILVAEGVLVACGIAEVAADCKISGGALEREQGTHVATSRGPSLQSQAPAPHGNVIEIIEPSQGSEPQALHCGSCVTRWCSLRASEHGITALKSPWKLMEKYGACELSRRRSGALVAVR